MDITLIATAATNQDYLELCQGRQNNLLCDDGRRQCTKLKDKIKDRHFDYCYMSPLVRDVETAIILIGDRVETIKDDRLIDREYGQFTGMLKKFHDFSKYWDYNRDSKDRKVEGIQELFKRCDDFLTYVMDKYEDGDILIVASPDIIRVLHHLILRNDREGDLLDISIGNLFYEELKLKREGK